MIKVSEVRSMGRRVMLVKAADEYSRMLQSYADSQGAVTRGGVQEAVNANLAASGYGKPRVTPKPAAPKPQAAAVTPSVPPEKPYDWDADRRRRALYGYGRVEAPKDYPLSSTLDFLDKASRWPEYAKKAWGKVTGRFRPAVTPVMGTTAPAR